MNIRVAQTCPNCATEHHGQIFDIDSDKICQCGCRYGWVESRVEQQTEYGDWIVTETVPALLESPITPAPNDTM